MRKHALDVMSLVAGLVLLAVAVSYLVGSVNHTHVNAQLVLPLALVGLGLAGLAGSVARARRPVPVVAAPAVVAPAAGEAADASFDPLEPFDRPE